MTDHNLIITNPFNRLGNKTEDIIEKGGFGAVLARAGVGKTALLVQLALNNLLRNRNVLHISLNDPVAKVGLWYKEIFNNIADQNNVSDGEIIWESILPHRFIMTFKSESFEVSKLEERLKDLSTQNVFSPNIVIIDGLSFDKNVAHILESLKRMARQTGMSFWFTVTTHRHEESESVLLPPQIDPYEALFDIIIQLKPEGKMIHVSSLKGNNNNAQRLPLVFDPAAMILKEQKEG